MILSLLYFVFSVIVLCCIVYNYIVNDASFIQGVSRRSLESLIDPDFSVSWMESMATPPSDERAAQVSVLSGIYFYFCLV